MQNDATEVTASLVVRSHMNHILPTSSVDGYVHVISVCSSSAEVGTTRACIALPIGFCLVLHMWLREGRTLAWSFIG